MSGPGTELKALFAKAGAKPDDIASDERGCGCSRMAAKMDNWGPDECEKRIEEIVETVNKNAKNRGYCLPFQEMIITRLVKTAIKRSRKKGYNNVSDQQSKRNENSNNHKRYRHNASN